MEGVVGTYWDVLTRSQLLVLQPVLQVVEIAVAPVEGCFHAGELPQRVLMIRLHRIEEHCQ